jgi:SHS2 domain-containing protein
MKYRFLEHTADVLYEAYGSTFEEALENAAEAMFGVIAKIEKIKPTEKVEVSESAKDLAELAVFVLSNLLRDSEIANVYLSKFKVEKFGVENGAYYVKGAAYGESIKQALAKTDVKAVTFHESGVRKENGGYAIRILLDI